MKVVLERKQAEADNITTFYFRPEKPVRYTAGQFIELTLKHALPDDRGQKRWFTLSSSPTDELLTITTKYAGDDASSSFKRTLFGLELGSELTMSDPMGDFVLPKLIQTPLIFVAGGIGITPFHSILSYLSSANEERPIKLLYAVNNEDEIIFQDVFDKAGIHPTIVVSDPSPAWGGERGRLNAEMIMGLEQPSDDTLVYVSGPEKMVQGLARDLHKQGLSRKQIVTDEFPNYKAY